MAISIPRPRSIARGIALALPLLAGCATVSRPTHSRMTLEESVIFHPRRYPEGNWETKTADAEDIWFTTPDGLRLNGRIAESAHPRAVVLYAEGNAGNLASRDWVLRLFRDKLNATVLIFDYRGYGRSDGTPSEAGILADARAARHWLAERAGVSESDVVLVGTSLGGGVMVDLAAKDGARGLVLENTFSSLPDVAAGHFRILPVGRLMATRLDSLAKIRDYRGPLLQTHGESDQVVPFALGKRLFDAANPPKRFVPVPGGGHNDPPSREYLAALDEFLDSLPPAGPVASKPPGERR